MQAIILSSVNGSKGSLSNPWPARTASPVQQARKTVVSVAALKSFLRSEALHPLQHSCQFPRVISLQRSQYDPLQQSHHANRGFLSSRVSVPSRRRRQYPRMFLSNLSQRSLKLSEGTLGVRYKYVNAQYHSTSNLQPPVS